MPWVEAWSSACSGLRLRRARARLPELGQDHGPRRLLRCAGRRGHRLCACRSGGSAAPRLIFTILIFGAFVPYQILLYPLARIYCARSACSGTIAGLIVIHIVFGLPVMSLLFRNFYAGCRRSW